MVSTTPLLSRKALSPTSVPMGETEEYDVWVDRLIKDGLDVVGSLTRWRLVSQHHKETVQSYTLPCNHITRLSAPDRPALAVHKDELWAGRRSLHFISRPPPSSPSSSSSAARRGSIGGLDVVPDPVGDEGDPDESTGYGLFEAFFDGLGRDHARNEKEYIDSLREVERVGVIREDETEVWRCVYSMPSPLSPRTFMNLLITRTLPPVQERLPPGFHTNHPPPPCRQFINITLPIDAPTTTSSSGSRSSSTTSSPSPRPNGSSSLDEPFSTSHLAQAGVKDKTVRARYVSVEWVKEVDIRLTGFEHGAVDGGLRMVRGLEWVMATSSSAGGNVPQAVTNLSLPSKITEDVPAFISWLQKQNPHLGKVESKRF